LVTQAYPLFDQMLVVQFVWGILLSSMASTTHFSLKKAGRGPHTPVTRCVIIPRAESASFTCWDRNDAATFPSAIVLVCNKVSRRYIHQDICLAAVADRPLFARTRIF
jgi:hypothetical protein